MISFNFGSSTVPQAATIRLANEATVARSDKGEGAIPINACG
jgi:hypothetical protein